MIGKDLPKSNIRNNDFIDVVLGRRATRFTNPDFKVDREEIVEAVQGRGAGPSRNGDREDGAAQAAGEARKDLRRARRAGGKRPRGRAARRRDPVKDCGDDEQHLDCGDEAR